MTIPFTFDSGEADAVHCAGLTLRLGSRRAARTVLSSLSLRIQRAEQVAIIGPSGAGKTSLLRLLGTALRATGSFTVLAQDPWRLPTRQRQQLRARIGMIHQAPPLPASQRVVTAVLAGRLGQWSTWQSVRSLWSPADPRGAYEALQALELGDRLYERCGSLSGGQLQRVGIARVLYQQADLVLADEPVSALDPVLAARSLAVLQTDCRSRGATLLASLHAVDLALSRFPRVIGLRDGQIVFDGPPSALDESRLHALYAGDEGTDAASFQLSAAGTVNVGVCR